MPTIIDSLVVAFGLDPSGFTKGRKEVSAGLKQTESEAARTAKEMEARGKQAAQFFQKVKNEVLSLTAAFLGANGLKNFAEQITRSDAAVGRLAKNLGMSTRDLSAWGNAIQNFGGTSQEMEGDLQGLVSKLEHFRLTGEGGEFVKYFRAAGVALTDSKGKIRDLNDLLLESADYLKKMSGPEAQAFGAGMGWSEHTVNMLREGKVNLQQIVEAQKKMNAVSEEESEAAIKRENAWKDVTKTLTGLARTMLDDLTPAILATFNAFKSFIDFAKEHTAATEAIVATLTLAFTALSVVKFAGLLEGIGAITTGINLTLSSVTLLLGKLSLLAAAGTAGWWVGSKLNNLLSPSAKNAIGGTLAEMFGDNKMPEPAAGPAYKGKGGGAAALFGSLEKQYGLPAGLLDSMWKQESNRGERMRSKAGAMGHFQFMPGTAKQYGVSNPDDLGQAAGGAAKMMADLMKQYGGSLPMALAAYNEGSGNLNRRGMNNLPLETQKYIPSIMGRMAGAQGGGNSSSSETHVGQITIQTAATDANGIAKAIGPAVQQYAFAGQANTGLN